MVSFDILSYLVMLLTPAGRKILYGDKFKVLHDDTETVTDIDEENILSFIQDEFQLSA